MMEPAPRSDEPLPRRRRRRVLGAVAALLAVHAVLAGASLWRTGIAFDEPAHLLGGFVALATGDHRLAENASVPARWAALPLLGLGVETPSADDGNWRRAEVFLVALGMMADHPDPDRLFVAGRLMILAISLGLGLLVFRIGRALHGEAGGLFALAAHALSPTIIAHAGRVTADLAAAALLLAATWTTWRLLERISPPRLAAGCVAVSLLLLTKASGAAIVPIAAVLVVVRVGQRRPLSLAWRGRPREVGGRRAAAALAAVVLAHAIAAVASAWAWHGFRRAATTDPAAIVAWEAKQERAFEGAGAAGAALRAVRDAGLLPEAFVHAYAHVAQHSERPAFLLGRHRPDGDRLFFPYVFTVKTALGVLAFLALGAAAGLRHRLARGAAGTTARSSGAIALWTLVVVYSAIAVASRLNIGHRHLLPVYPALFVLAGAAAAWLRHPHRLVRALPWAALVLLAAESIAAWPHYLTFFNGLGGGADTAWRRVVDSSLDWGQDLPRLRAALDRSGWVDGRVYLAYFGTDDPHRRGIDAIELYGYHPWAWRHGLARGFLMEPGRYVISATLFQGLNVDPAPPWSDRDEAEYRLLRRRIDPAFDPRTPLAQVRALTSDREWRADYLELHRLRFVRTCEWLRRKRRRPDRLLTPCYPGWQLSADDLRAALREPLPPFDG